LDQAERIAALALAQRLPAFSASGDIPQHEGSLLTYGPSIVELWRRSAYYVRRVLAGTEPSDLPVEQATRIKLVINLRTARTLGLDVPAQLLARMLDRDPQQRLDELTEDDLAGHRLRSLDRNLALASCYVSMGAIESRRS